MARLRPLLMRALYLLAVLVAVTILTSLLINLIPGDPAQTILGRGATPQALTRVRHQMHLDQPFFVRYWQWLDGMFHGNFGDSLLTKQPVGESLAQRIPVTLELVAVAQVIALVVSVPLGVWTGYRQGRLLDRIVTGVVFLVLSVPPFVVAVLVVLLFSVRLGWLPASGYVHLTADPASNLRNLFLPCVTLALALLGGYVRVLRAEVIATLREDYIATAYSKGLPVRAILIRHALRPSSFTLLTIVGLSSAGLIGGAVIVEQIFSVPGVGSYLIGAILQRDYVAVQGAVAVVAAGIVMMNLAVDVAYTFLDPRTAGVRAT